jgi:hypothetical protein
MYYSVAGRDIEREIVPLANDQKLAILTGRILWAQISLSVPWR